MKQVNIIDSLRSLAALSVCLYHFICTTTGLTFPGNVSSFFYYGQYGIYIFFTISGFIIPWSMYHNHYSLKSIFKFLSKRLIRLEPPYLVSIVLVLCFIFIKTKLHIGVESGDVISAKRIGLHFGYLINFFPQYKWLNNVYWTLAIEFQYYLAMSLMFFLYIDKRVLIRVIAYLICFIGAYYIPDPALYHYPAYAPLFLLGICVFQYKTHIITIYECIIIIIACFAYNYIVIDPLMAYCGLLTALVILWFSSYKIPGLNQMGKMSYSIYLVHPIIGAAVVNILSRHISNNFQKTGIIMVGLIVTFISAYIMYLLIEKTSKNLSSRIKL
ncbi:MAG: acyltransferase [Bacteroidota bacterium]